jgi:error-prone DNA polymerase
MTDGYIELNARSAFSFLEGASLPEELVSTAAGFGMTALALIDRDGFYGSPRFHMAAKKADIRAHIGAEITCTDGHRYPLLAESRTGYQNLCRLITRMKLRAKKGEGAATPEEFAEYAEGVICLTPTSKIQNPTSDFERLLEIFGSRNVYAQIQRHYDREQDARNHALIENARRLKIPLLATNGVQYARAEQREILDILTCVRNKVTIDAAGRLLARNSERRLKSPAEMARLFADLPEAIANTCELSSRLNFTLADLGYEFPRYPVAPGETQMSFLRQRTDEGARQRYRPYHDRARLQIERELALIEKLKLPGYFLIVWDIVNFCREQGILAQGRGSAANSAVCYALGITAVDPVRMELLFERFLSEERGEWPDIDIDLPSGDRRERVIQYVYQRYGKLGAAMTANVITYRGRSAAREVGKALGFDEPTVARLSSLSATWGWKDPNDTAERQFSQAGLDPRDRRIRKFLELYVAVQDLPRHLGQHSGGMVICQGQLDSVVPLEPATMPGRVVVQWDKEDCADLGIIKVDLLGLGMMAAIEEMITLVHDAYHEDVDLAQLPQDDHQVYAALQEADTIGMFQVESRAQMASLPRLRPERFYDVVVQVALIRPGPIVGKMVHPYLRRRQGREAPDCLHPSLEPVLRRTLGVPLFQEQLLRMAMLAAGFTGGEAEELRRALGFKRSEKRMGDIEVKLRRGMDRNGITGAAQDAIVQSITAFALYGFPESHAASFALLAYASAWLKVHYHAAFTAALLNNQPMGFYHPSTLVKDAQRHGVRVLPVDITCSDWLCTIGPDLAKPTMRLGFRYVRGLREEAARAILRERPFTSVDDVARRVPELRKDEMRKLAEVGALNPLQNIHRRTALWESERVTRFAGPLLDSVEPDWWGGPPGPRPTPSSAFVDGREKPARGPAADQVVCPTSACSPLAPMSDEERLIADFRGAGLTVGRHPMARRREELAAHGVWRAVELKGLPDGRQVRVAGCVIVRQRPGTAKGFVFLSLEDETGIANIIVEPDLFQRERQTLVSASFLIVEGVLQNQDHVTSVKARHVSPLSAGAAPQSHDFH